jgi:putative ABC transport system ATP-binding protein
VLELRQAARTHRSGSIEVRALREVDLAVTAGELVAVMGPSGSGKSTLLNLAGGLDQPTSGQVMVEGVDLSDLNPTSLARLRRVAIGFVFQEYNLIPALTVAENVALPLELEGASPRGCRAEVADGLARVGIGELAGRYPDELSGGQRQRVAIARAVIGSRRLILADEPTGALDTETGEEVLALLRARCDEGAAGMLVTHDARHAAWADRVVFLRDGLIVDETRRDGAGSLLSAGAER